MMKNKTLIISAFPGCGKTTFYKKWSRYSNENVWSGECYEGTNIRIGKAVLDSDSSEFSWIKDSEGNNTSERNPEFPKNYIEHIKSKVGVESVIFVSSHKLVRDALKDEGMDYIIIYPDLDMKSTMIERYRDRGDDSSFIEFMDSNYESFIQEIESDPFPKKIRLDWAFHPGIDIDLMLPILSNSEV